MTELESPRPTPGRFYATLGSFFAERRPDLPAHIASDTELWETGYMDSFALVETLAIVEELTGRPIEIGADDLEAFRTMASIYARFVAS